MRKTQLRELKAIKEISGRLWKTYIKNLEGKDQVSRPSKNFVIGF